jgi:hypothetical protein
MRCFGAKAAQTRNTFFATLPFMTTKATTPWGAATLVEEVQLQQQAGPRRFSSLVQLLETPRGERLVRFAYATGGSARRGPVTLRERDVERLRAALAERPALRELLGLGGDA